MKKLNLEKLAVKSFLTAFDAKSAATVKGGSSVPDPPDPPDSGGQCTGYYCGTEGPGCSPPEQRK